MKKALLLLLFPVLTGGVWLRANSDTLFKNQSQYLEMKGRILKSEGQQRDDDKVPLDSAVISVFNESGLQVITALSDSKGKVSFKLPLDREFRISISRPGYIRKFIDVNTKVLKADKDNFSFAFDVDIFESIAGLDVSVLDNPVAKVDYKVLEKDFFYDATYTNKVNYALQKMYREYYELKRKQAGGNDSTPTAHVSPKSSSGTSHSVPYGKNTKPH